MLYCYPTHNYNSPFFVVVFFLSFFCHSSCRKDQFTVFISQLPFSSNNSRPSINRLPRIIAPLWRKYLKWSPPTSPVIFSFFYSLPVKLKIDILDNKQSWSGVKSDPAKLIGDDSSSGVEDTVLTLKINPRTKFGTLKAHVQYIWCNYFSI